MTFFEKNTRTDTGKQWLVCLACIIDTLVESGTKIEILTYDILEKVEFLVFLVDIISKSYYQSETVNNCE